jgi:hypothetical protein
MGMEFEWKWDPVQCIWRSDKLEKRKAELDLEQMEFGMAYSRDQQKRERIDAMLKVIATVNEGYIKDMDLKNEAVTLAAKALVKELKELSPNPRMNFDGTLSPQTEFFVPTK